MASFISLGLFGDISDADIKWEEYILGPMESTMADGRHYGIPFATNCTALFYNKDMFDAAGLDYPDGNTTWDQFHELAKALTKDGVTGFGNAATNTDEGTFQCLQWLYTAGGSYTDIKGGTEAYGLMQEMIDRSKKPFTIVMPPPNITGQLHMGHALDNTMQDILIRFKRMQGYNALWQPGTDHASIATEVKIIEKLKEEGVDKHDRSSWKAVPSPL